MVDPTLLHAQCLLSAIPDPPKGTSNVWKDAAIIDVAGIPYAWIMIWQESADVPLDDARVYLQWLQTSLNNRGANTVSDLCRKDWDVTREHAVITAIVRVDGKSSTWEVLGTKADRAGGAESKSMAVTGDAAAARKRAVTLARGDLGGAAFKTKTAPSEWFDATR